MLQSKLFILAPDFISSFKKVDVNEASTLWSIVFEPSKTTIEDVFTLVFDQRSYNKNVFFLILPCITTVF